MKKRKMYEVSVINKTYSKTYSDQTKFYTSDTALELNFHLKEVEYDFDSAEIILLNVDDRSLVTRPVTKSAEGFIYELEDDIVAHYGEWKCQLKFNEGGEIYVSSPVVFRIENDLNNDRPPQLTEVNTWKTLRGIADGLIADIRSELELVAAKMSEMDSAESERQQSEASRVNAEEQRKIDHANRSAELAGKADKVVIKNFIENGDVESTYIFEKGSYINFLKTGEIVGQINYTNTQSIIPAVSGHEYYVRAVFSQGTVRERLYFIYEDNSSSYNDDAITETDMVSGIITADKTGNANLRLYGSAGEKIKKSVMTIDLTETFGSGNEPTKEEMDELIKVTGYIDGEYALNTKDIMGHLMKDIREKADKKQEDWIKPTLLNGWVATESLAYSVGFYKDEFGIVRLKGRVQGGVGSIFTLPVGYRSKNVVSGFLAQATSSDTPAKVNTTTSGNVSCQNGVTGIYLDGIAFRAEV